MSQIDEAALEAAMSVGVEAGMETAAALKSQELTHKFSDEYFAMAVSQDAAKAALAYLAALPKPEPVAWAYPSYDGKLGVTTNRATACEAFPGVAAPIPLYASPEPSR